MSKPNLPPQIRQDIEDLIETLWESELEDAWFVERDGGSTEDHPFFSLVRLSNWLNGRVTGGEVYLKEYGEQQTALVEMGGLDD